MFCSKQSLKILLLSVCALFVMNQLGCSNETGITSEDPGLPFVNVEANQCPYNNKNPLLNYKAYKPVDFQPSWEKSGDRIIYLHLLPGRSTPQLWMVNAETGDKFLIREGVFGADWFPSGDSLVVTLEDKNLYILGLDGEIKDQITFDGDDNLSPRVSPTGRYVVWDQGIFRVQFRFLDFKTGDTWSIDGEHKLLATQTGDWNPEEFAIAYVSYLTENSGSTAIFVMDLKGRFQNQVTVRDVPHEAPQWSPLTGRYLVYAAWECEWIFDLYAHDLETNEMFRMTNSGGRTPSWSPTEDRIVYLQHDRFKENKDGNGYLHIYEVETGMSTQLTYEADYLSTNVLASQSIRK